MDSQQGARRGEEMTNLPYPLDSYGKKLTSQNDEDGIIAVLIQHIQPSESFVEFGAEPHQSNCLALHLQGWRGLFMDAHWGCENPRIYQEFVTPANVNYLLRRYQVPKNFGVLSIDVDGQDIWIWEALEHRPPIVVIEYNGALPKASSVAMPRDDDFKWKYNQSYGASLLALTKVGQRKGYHLVYANGVNAFFVDYAVLSNPEDFQYDKIYRAWPDAVLITDPKTLGFQEIT
jgi:hypothetical protein